MGWKFKKPIEDKTENVQVQEEVKQEIKSEPKKFIKTDQEKHRVVVVKELPIRHIREHKDEDGTIVHFITIEEALTELMND